MKRLLPVGLIAVLVCTMSRLSLAQPAPAAQDAEAPTATRPRAHRGFELLAQGGYGSFTNTSACLFFERCDAASVNMFGGGAGFNLAGGFRFRNWSFGGHIGYQLLTPDAAWSGSLSAVTMGSYARYSALRDGSIAGASELWLGFGLDVSFFNISARGPLGSVSGEAEAISLAFSAG